MVSVGCDVDSWMDPSRTGYFEHTPTSVPILRQIDVIEVEREPFATEVGAPRAEDLAFGATDYKFGYGDVLEIVINDLYQENKPEGFQRSVDQAGKILLPVVGQIQVAGLSQQEVAHEIVERLRVHIPNPS
ncbi:MAG: polysaccharide biosynthesis/export family protein, partial [Phycisphaerae bacterium]|nr:polysaccharide biosynthesis/export family protein [Phycisphaerae bacterium]